MRIKYLLGLVCLSLLLNFSCSSNAEKKENEGLQTFVTLNPTKVDTMYAVDYVADITAINNIEIRSRVKGYLEDIHVDEGERVTKGQLLFTINKKEYEGELLKAQSNYKNAVAELRSSELELKNAEMLFEENVVAKTEVDMAIANMEAAKAMVDVARSLETNAAFNLGFTEIRAPFDGIINRIDYRKGSLIDETTLLTSLSDDDKIYAYFNVSEKEYLDYVQIPELLNSDVELVLANGEVFKNRGEIQTVEGEMDRVTGSIFFRAVFQNENNLLKHGSSGNVRMRRKLKNALVIPQKSAFEIQDKIFVYTVDNDSTIRMKSFKIDQRIPHLYIVESGLDESDQFIFEGIQNITNGQKISPEKRTLQEVFEEDRLDI